MNLNIIKATYDKPKATMTLNGKNTEIISSKVNLECPISLILFNMILEFITRAIRQEEEIKGTQRRKKSNYPYFQII
jgi:hypothetical protein